MSLQALQAAILTLVAAIAVTGCQTVYKEGQIEGEQFSMQVPESWTLYKDTRRQLMASSQDLSFLSSSGDRIVFLFSEAETWGGNLANQMQEKTEFAQGSVVYSPELNLKADFGPYKAVERLAVVPAPGESNVLAGEKLFELHYLFDTPEGKRYSATFRCELDQREELASVFREAIQTIRVRN